MKAAHIGLVWNPSKVERDELERAFADVEQRVTWVETSADDPGRGATQEAVEAGADVVFAAGGDGTVRAVAEYLAEIADTGETVPELAIIPLGTGNLLARNLGVPLNDVSGAIEHGLSATGKPLDIGWAALELDGGTERHAFAVMAGFGIDAHMITETDDDLKDQAGWVAYVESLGRAVSASEIIDIRLGVDGEPLQPDHAHTLIVGNCGTLQGGITLLPNADPADGKLDVLVLNADGIAGWLDTMRNLVWDNGVKRLFTRSAGGSGDGQSGADQGAEEAESSESATHRRIETLSVELDEPRVFEVDGDDLGEARRIEISVQPGAIRVRS